MTTAPIAPAGTATPIVNIAARVSAAARAHPDKPAVIACRGMTRDGRTRYRSLTFAQLERSIDATPAVSNTRGSPAACAPS
jgi:acyl-CoA synthetase (AMP-forming)/AMP-acid ligase II